MDGGVLVVVGKGRWVLGKSAIGDLNSGSHGEKQAVIRAVAVAAVAVAVAVTVTMMLAVLFKLAVNG